MLKLGIEAEKDLKARESTYLLLDLVCKVIFWLCRCHASVQAVPFFFFFPSDCVFYSLAQLVCDSSQRVFVLIFVTLLFSRLYLCLDRQRLSVPYNGRVRIVFSLRFAQKRLSRGLQGMVNVNGLDKKVFLHSLRLLNNSYLPVRVCHR